MKCWSWKFGRFGWYTGYDWKRFRMGGQTIRTNEGKWVPFLLGIFLRVDDTDHTTRDCI